VKKPVLSISIAGIKMKNPVMTASGTFGYAKEFEPYLDLSRLGAIVVKTITLLPRAGAKPARVVETPAGMLNAIGLQNVGVDDFIREKMPFLRRAGCRVIVNVFGFTVEDYLSVIGKLNDCEGIDAYELNVSCPNTEKGGLVFGASAEATRDLVARARDSARRSVLVKLSPNVTDITEIARAAESAGADALTVANTYLAMAIDPETFVPRIRNVTAGLSGPAIRPITLRLVFETSRAVKIPVIGLGGIETGSDAIEYFLAGASAVQIGTASFKDPRSAVRVLVEVEAFLQRKAMRSIRELIGKVNLS
jgi:dihydroorotate dehydrogenase (NAD+) catalytic subunit